MTTITDPGERMRADFPPGTIVFLIGMRINRLRAVGAWMPIFRAMPAMLNELRAHPEFGLLESRMFWAGRDIITIQYWRSFDHLMRYATATDADHFPAWMKFRNASTAGAVGIWHEAYEVNPARAHTMYVDMPTSLMARATTERPAKEMPPQAVQRHPVSRLYGGASAG